MTHPVTELDALVVKRGRGALMVNGALDYFSFASTLPEARGKRTTKLKVFRRALSGPW